MAANFKISTIRKSRNLHVGLAGDFDGSSALELLHVIQEKCEGIAKVFIHTNGLNKIYPFGRDIFQTNLCTLNGRPIRLVFTGKKVSLLAPERRWSS